MSHLYELHEFVLHEVPWIQEKEVLDIGCGRGIWGYLLRAEKKGETALIVGLDLYLPYLKFVKKFGPYDELVLADATNLPFRDRSFDFTLACEVIEHLPQELGDRFFIEVERVSRKKTILTTPNGPWELNKPANISTETHKSAYTVADLAKRGYKVRGVGFAYFKFYKAKQQGLQKLWASLFFIVTPFSYTLPFLAEFLIGTKEIR